MAQPESCLLANHLRGAADHLCDAAVLLRLAAGQCELLGKLPAVNHAEVLGNVLQTLTRTNVGMDTIETSIMTRMAAMETRMDAMQVLYHFLVENTLNSCSIQGPQRSSTL